MWVRLDDKWNEHPKILAVSEEAATLWLNAITYCNRNNTKGFVPLGAVSRCSRQPNPQALAEECAAVRVPGCRGGLFDVTDGGYLVHDYEDYQLAHTDSSPSQSKSKLHAERSTAGAKGARARWAGHTPAMANDGNLPSATDGKTMANPPLPSVAIMANDGNLPSATDGKTMANPPLPSVAIMANDGGISPGQGAEAPGSSRACGIGPGPSAAPIANGMANDGNLPSEPMANGIAKNGFPVPVPVPVHTPAQAGARVTSSSPGQPQGLATADVWLAAVRGFPALALLHQDQKWAHEVEGTSAHRGTRAEDATAAVLAFIDKNAGLPWTDRASLVRELGGFVARAKQIGDDMRARAARQGPEKRTRKTNGHAIGRGAPVPNPNGAADLNLDTGRHTE